MGMGFRSGQMVQSTWVIGITIGHKERASSFTLTVTFMKAIGSMIRPMVMELIIMLMELFTKGSGSTTFNTDLERKAGKTAPYFKASIQRARSMELVTTSGMMEVSTREIGTKIKLMASELTVGWMADNIRVIGSRTTWRTWASTLGLMAGATWVSTKTIRNTGTASTSGTTANYIKAHGCSEDNMVSEFTKRLTIL